jgi:hypothetical protein
LPNTGRTAIDPRSTHLLATTRLVPPPLVRLDLKND